MSSATSDRQLCQCLTCGRMHHALSFGPPPLTEDEKRIKAIQERVRPTLTAVHAGPIGGPPGLVWAGDFKVYLKISEDDFNYLISSWLAWKFTAKCSEAWEKATPDEKARVEQEVMREERDLSLDMLAMLKRIIAADDEFRSQLPANWKVDTLSEVCAEAKALVAKVVGEQ